MSRTLACEEARLAESAGIVSFIGQPPTIPAFDAISRPSLPTSAKKAGGSDAAVAEAGHRFRDAHGPELDEHRYRRVMRSIATPFFVTGRTVLTRAFSAKPCAPWRCADGEARFANGTPVAAAIFSGAGRLFGVTGPSSDYNSRTRTCYHQGIEFCIENRVAR